MYSRKKQRGQRKKLNTLLNRIDDFVPFQRTNEEYEHFHVPSSMLIESYKTAGKVKTVFCRKWLEVTKQFIEQKPSDLPFCKVVALIDSPNFWSSQIIIFYSKEYYDTFWNRNNAEQKWEPIDSKAISFAEIRNMPTTLSEKGYIETICDDDYCQKSELWFYGDI